jgi:hypothetical protein
VITQTGREALEHPVWRLVASRDAIPAGDPPPSETVLCHLHDTSRHWRLALEDGIGTAPRDRVVVVVYDRALPRAVLGALARRWRRPARTPRVGVLLRTLRRQGVEVRSRYAIWPSVTAPRVAIEAGNYRSLRWIQRSGVLGGGGRSLVLRALARSFLFTPFAFVLAPGVALVVRVTGPSSAAR